MIEVAINELAGKERNPNVPYSVDEVVDDAIACARAGASIVHFHARDAVTGEQRWFDTQFYREAFARVRAEVDVLLYPTQPGSGMDRCPHVLELADEGLEHATVDIFPPRPFAPDAAEMDPNLEVMAELRRRGVVYSLGVRELGHMRYLGLYRERGLLDDVVHLKIFLRDGLFGPIPDARGLLAYLDHVPPGMTAHWFTTLFDGEPDGRTFRRVSMLAAAMGGHIRTGLGDNPVLDGHGTYTNVEHVQMAVDLARAAGREVATPEETRHMLRTTSVKEAAAS
jgi:3-keto-5-aminohexanoate cleavage enzyme